MDTKYLLPADVSNFQGCCPHCSERLYGVLPVEPVFTLDQAAAFIPMKRNALQKWISQKKDKLSSPALYRHDKQHRVHRYLTAGDIKTIRDYSFVTRLATGKYKRLYALYQLLEKQSDAADQAAN